MGAVEPIVLYRWVAKITYRHDDHNEVRLVSFEEPYELHDIIVRGPNFYAIESIDVRIGARAAATTVEQGDRP